MSPNPLHPIVIDGMARNDLRKALRQWIALYEKDLPSGLAFTLHDAGDGRHVLVADDRLDPERFHYLVNYLHYPEGIAHEARVEGFTTAMDPKYYPQASIGKRMMLYVPCDDREGDNVYAVTSEGREWKLDFGGRLEEVRTGKRYLEPAHDLRGSEPVEVFTTRGRTAPLVAPPDLGMPKSTRRFTIIAGITVGILALGHLGIRHPGHLLMLSSFTGVGVYSWFLVDHVHLRSTAWWFKCNLLAVLLWGHAWLLLDRSIGFSEADMLVIVAPIPLLPLLFQLPLRRVFKWIVGREPFVSRPAPSVPDFIYMVLLILLPLLTSTELGWWTT